MPRVRIAPSLLAGNLACLAEELAAVEAAGADLHHIDVMDVHFVPNLTFGPPVVGALQSVASVPLDVHLMVSNPEQVALDYVAAGADRVSFHIEAATHPVRLAGAIKGHHRKPEVGVAINPGTFIDSIQPMLEYVDFVLIMSVNPGFAGQRFLPSALGRVARLRELARSAGVEIEVAVDGGVCKDNAAQLREQGATVLVAGSAVFGAQDRAQEIAQLRGSK
jgi:ribulose-phosphate 3-epimerase